MDDGIMIDPRTGLTNLSPNFQTPPYPHKCCGYCARIMRKAAIVCGHCGKLFPSSTVHDAQLQQYTRVLEKHLAALN